MSSFHFTPENEVATDQEGVSWFTEGLLPPWLHFALAWRPKPDMPLQLDDSVPPEHLCRLILEAVGPLQHEAMPLFERYRHRLPEVCAGISKSELLRICHYRELLSQGRQAVLLRHLDRELCAADQRPWYHCEMLSLFWHCRLRDTSLCQKAAEREFMLRVQGPPSWRLQSARWRSLGEPPRLLEPILRGARSQGIQFHPAQLQPQFGCSLRDIDHLVRGLGPAGLSLLLDHLLAGPRLSLRLDPQGWLALRPLLVSLLAGEGMPFTELPLHCLPCPLGSPPEGLPPATLVIHCPGERRPREDQLPAGNWRVILLHEDPGPADGTPGTLALDWNPGPVLPFQAPEPGAVIPLKYYVTELEQRYIREVLQHHNGHKTRACASLGITRQTLYAKLGKAAPRRRNRG